MRVTIDLDEETFAAKSGSDVIIFQRKEGKQASVRITTSQLQKILDHNNNLIST